MTAVGAGRIIPHPFARCTATPKTEFHHTPKPSSSTPPNRHPPRPTPVILHACGGSVCAASSALTSPRSKTDGPHAWAMTAVWWLSATIPDVASSPARPQTVILHACGGSVCAASSALTSPRSKTDGPHAWAMTAVWWLSATIPDVASSPARPQTVILHACGGSVCAASSALTSPRSKTDGPHAWAMTGDGVACTRPRPLPSREGRKKTVDFIPCL
jgi:hypothetical protein